MIPNNTLSKAERELYDFIADFIQMRGYAPSITEMCSETGRKSRSGVSYTLNRLESLGLIRRYGEIPRQVIELTNGSAKYTGRVGFLPIYNMEGEIVDRMPTSVTESNRFILRIDPGCLLGTVMYKGTELRVDDMLLIDGDGTSSIGAAVVKTPTGKFRVLSEGSINGELVGTVIGLYRS